KAEIHADIRRLADTGRAIILISSDLPEVLAHSDRIGVFRQGRLAGMFAGGAAPEVIAAAALPEAGEQLFHPHPPKPGEGDQSPGPSSQMPREMALLSLVLFLTFFLQGRAGHFLDGANLGDLLSDSILLGCVACGAALVILAGGIDISI